MLSPALGAGMSPKIHLRDPDHPTKAMCGMGYDWPSGIALRNTTDEVTCRNCMKTELLEPLPV